VPVTPHGNFPDQPRVCALNRPGRISGSTMSLASAETFIRNAKAQIAQRDINDSLLKAITELTGEIKRLEEDVRRVRREVQIARRF
jgi:hypothetical protein